MSSHSDYTDESWRMRLCLGVTFGANRTIAWQGARIEIWAFICVRWGEERAYHMTCSTADESVT